ncbi:MAG: hypothetical protein SGILL_003505, partial [Bacillariaceae sp.]
HSAFGKLPTHVAGVLQEATMSTSAKRRSTRKAKADDEEPGNKKQKRASAKTKKTTKKATSGKKDAKTSANDRNNPWYTVFTKDDEQYNEYMKKEWGFEKRGDEAMFEKLSLEGAQAGLSWLTILRKREAYRKTFHGFDVDKVAAMKPKDVQAILDTAKSVPTRDVVVKHRGKIEAVIHNAKCIQQMRTESKDKKKKGHGVFDEFLWSFVDDRPIVTDAWNGENLADAPSTSPESTAMSKALRDKGFKFVGPTTCYSMMQAYGMVIDHPVGSPEYDEALKRLVKRSGGYQTRSKKQE